ncbi:hypothetical protein JG687_00019416 [Phytophthora cactorum]|uniref:M96 mating-specific protein family n=1 Tax=Phytophthora cactorum TaxID=29920 RepID=A0A329S2Y1_9STRA|nr:hypothetical protein Pcac1_g15064 [Phytophthora cactorum]KAG2792451.1 hypothetical protein PC111_g23458 [Phytophthora cactorum]KAG2833895.1 hypothetical protein PC112_g6301 [Phytophthora cactorum]KAG2851975.1 hypothetical protein PC113_g15429 [Phytophthora cactorum]KAG2891794.1 hypothetical protein PC114_g16866 [Phytophthora cactorum]
MAQDEVETLEAALKFISQYELSTDAATTETKAVNVTSAFQHSHKLNKTHSLEIPERSHAFKHSHSLEIPEETNAAFDPDLYAAEAFLDDVKLEPELFAPQSEIQDFLNLSVRPTLNETKPQCGTIASKAITSPSLQPRRRLSKKEEIRDLRDTVAELSHQLDQLQASSTPNSPAEEEARVGFILSKPESLWQQVAARQLLLRQKAEETNAQLRKLAETRVRQTKNLKRMLSRRNDAETLELIGLKRRKQMLVTGPPPTDNAEVFAKLVQGTDELYVGLDKLYVEQGMPQVPCPGRKRQVQRDAVNGAIAVFLDKNKVPFDLEKTQKAVWKLLSGRHRKDGPYTQGTIDWESQQHGDTVTNYVSFTCVAGSVSALLQVREVARKYVTEDRATFICRSVMEPTPTGESGRIGLKFNETMTVVVRRGEPLSSGQETSIIESYLCATRHDEGSAAARKFRGEVYVDIAIEGWEQSYASNNQDIENLLFEDAIQVG